MRRLLILAVALALPIVGRPHPLLAQSIPFTVSAPRSSAKLDVAAVAAAVRPSVVMVIAWVHPPELEAPILVGQGTGIIVDEAGHIVTNSHVLEDADTYEVTISDGRRIEAKLVGRDQRTDLAVLKIEPAGLAWAQFGDSDGVSVGQEVIAVGFTPQLPNPPNARAGLVTSLEGRVLAGEVEYDQLIRTDVALFPGDSGGPLLDSDARVVGVNTAIIPRRAGRPEESYSIPINRVQPIVHELVEHGEVVRPTIGLVGYNVTEASARSFGVPARPGVIIAAFLPGSAARAAGLDVGDIIIAVDGLTVQTIDDLNREIARRQPGERITLTVVDRHGAARDVIVTVSKLA